ncbi:hypothetical protein FB567DRAFT_535147 [Paraphoma chrysanthemicola]|uniref:Uncharacterized protein n=1 Tax=Paraphoma chrysanthemicola TaxID=798071 RepID=A0A8K0VUM3_9PLEO|nr:hypothetical protein FB567DRAFT_535147 [Paraphoma chrysanthemicola]
MPLLRELQNLDRHNEDTNRHQQQTPFFFGLTVITMSQSLSSTAPRSGFDLLDESLRRNIFGRLGVVEATCMATTYPEFGGEIGAAAYHTHRAKGPWSLFTFLYGSMEIPEFAPWVRRVDLSSPFDEAGQSGFFEWLLELEEMSLSPGHPWIAIRQVGVQFLHLCVRDGVDWDAEGNLDGWQHWPPGYHNGTLIMTILPTLCPNLEVLEMPASWDSGLARRAWSRFPNSREVRRV